MNIFTEWTRTKIVATVGPACRSPEQLRALVAAGVNVFRLNMAHGNIEDHQQVIETIREINRGTNLIGILADLAGPKIRLGQLAIDPMPCPAGAVFDFIRGDISNSPTQLVCNYPKLVDELSVDDRIMLADGTVALRVTEKTPDYVRCKVTEQGEVRSRQGINLPGAVISLPALTPFDIMRAQWAAEQKVDFVGLSFVRSPAEVIQLTKILRDRHCNAMVISKIEKPEALEHLTEIVKASGAVMVARGDLGVEIDVAEMPIAQKRIIRTCNRWQRPVIVATQMLDSMQNAKLPTRAETTDVANAILDGADACMLSGETAIGKYPVDAVKMMKRIMHSTEKLLKSRPPRELQVDPPAGAHPVTHSVVFAAATSAQQCSAKLVVIVTSSGATALAKSNQRDFIPTAAATAHPETLTRMTLFWGILPLRDVPVGDPLSVCQSVDVWGKAQAGLVPGDRVVIVMGTGVGTSGHNMLMVHEVQ